MTNHNQNLSIEEVQTFLLGLWVEKLGSERSEIRMRVRNISTNETRYFRDWATLIIYLTTALENLAPKPKEDEA